ncbi:hypothetical protein E8E12_000995 [Didymella heteroderae]|uniref:Lactate/malate dehydrogenase C-terminal domain-containing protein n=1 Tax=Didymella heteroderae TaxID=1769908 RepID=A0A9P4WRS4_9PLEO|nr:hypothetical protein E8E12_000995 [Didymella heteroderae]
MKPFRRDTILLIVTNPVDLLTSLAQRLSGLPSAQVIGTGTLLDSVWLRGILADKYDVAASSIDAMVLGEHCGTRFVCWPSVSIGGIPIDDFATPSVVDKLKIIQDCKDEGQSIIEEKGAIVFGIAAVVATLCTSILFDQRRVYPISHMQPDLGCCLSMPTVLGKSGAENTPTVSLTLIEKEELQQVAVEMNQVLARLLDSV